MTEFYNDPVYIKMCEKSIKIQDGVYKYGDCVTFNQGAIAFLGEYKETDKRGFVEIPIPDLDNIVDDDDRYVKPSCKIFRQDQLQKMIDDDALIALSEFGFEYRDDGGGLLDREDYPFDSIEKLWLAFVMKKKFNKTWSDKKEEWV